MEPNRIYTWEIETSDGKIKKQYESDGKENTWKTLQLDRVVRVSFIPSIHLLPQHDVLIDINSGEQFIKRFGRGFIKQAADGFKLREYLNCCVTNRYRVWIFSNGRTMVTRPDYEVNL